MNDKHKNIFRIIYHIILIIITGSYFALNYSSIIDSPNTIDIIITLAILILVFLPLVSEISAFGLSVKKELQKTKEEMKSEVRHLQNYISNNIENKNTVNNNNYYGVPKVNEYNQKMKDKHDISLNQQQKSYDANEKIVLLANVRMELETNITQILTTLDLPYNFTNGLKILEDVKILPERLVWDIRKVLQICNRGLHGEIIADEYVRYIEETMNEFNSLVDKDFINKLIDERGNYRVQIMEYRLSKN